MANFPRCAECRVTIQPREVLVLRQDGRVQHANCPLVSCPVCAGPIRPGEPIRRDGEQMLHGNCWVRWFETARKAS
jgi:hypothetical protein